MNAAVISVIAILIINCSGQRSPYAGRSPIGYPALVPTTTTTAATIITANSFSNRFRDVVTTRTVPTTTMRLPIEARGDRELVNRLLKLPIDKQPFWIINWQALEENRKNPQTYVLRSKGFFDNNFRG